MSKLIERITQLEAEAGDWDLSSLTDNESQYFFALVVAYPKLRAVVLAALEAEHESRTGIVTSRLRSALAALEEDV